MKCGDRGHLAASGEPCQQTIGKHTAACIWHSRSAEGRSALAMKGGIASRMRRFLSKNAPPPEFASTEAIVVWAQTTAQQVLCGDLDPRAASEARQLAGLAIQARAADAQQQLVEALLRMEHGGAAVMLLSRLQQGLVEGRTRPLPPRVLRASPVEPEPAA
jgi:hypothetical protein